MTATTDLLTVSAAFTDNPRTRPILEGKIVPAGTRFNVQSMSAGDIFARQLGHAEFDVSEMSVSSLAIATAKGNRDWIGLPVFTTRHFFHAGVVVQADSPYHKPEDLRGKRIGVMEFQQTSVVWIRGIFEHHFGLAPTEMTWVMERNPEVSHGGKTGFVPPPGIELTYVPKETSLAAMLQDGEIAAILFFPDPHRGSIDDRHDGGRARLKKRPLFADPEAESQRFFKETGMHPINHGVIVRRTLAEQQPWLLKSVYDALVAARDSVTDQQAMPYGIEANRKTIDAVLDYVYEQGLAPRRVALEELFVEPS